MNLPKTDLPIEKMTLGELLGEWRQESALLAQEEDLDPRWGWKPLQSRLEKLYALAHEIRAKKGEAQAGWQP
ncbi:MAG: hypothetical protein OEW12_09090 [Deltaproteobacteria bacterium]|nr:hypothetical protein [Deltaproteobacteria bacterium]